MNLNPIGVAVPFFFLLILIEWLIARHQERPLYRFNDAMSDFACGMGDQLIGVAFKTVSLVAYTWTFQVGSLFELDAASPWTWVLGTLGVDLAYYAFHRFGHRVNWAWAAHSVHHQSEEYNLAVALRQPWFSQFFSWWFYIPLALLGVPPVVWLTSYSINLLYQFWIHTRLIGKLGPLEWVFNTPSHHRVHHGTNPAYIDKNYAGIFIIWDRLFGTFEVESETPLYGTLQPLRSWNPLVANVKPWWSLAQAARGMPTGWDKLRVWWMPPGWHPVIVPSVESLALERGYDATGPKGINAYFVAHLLPIAALMSVVLTFEATLDVSIMLTIAAIIAWTAMAWAGLFECRTWSVLVELVRLCCVSIAAAWMLPSVALFLVVPFAAVSARWVWRQRAPLMGGMAANGCSAPDPTG